MTRLILMTLAVVASHVVRAQCNAYCTLKEGSEWEFKSYSAKDKLTGSNRQKVTSFSPEGDGYTAVVNSVMYDQNEKEVMQGDLQLKCVGGTMVIDMRNFINADQMKAFSGQEMKIESEDLEIPSQLTAGQSLKDGKLVLSTSGTAVPMKMTISITDRKVVGKESITTPAGTFDCYKITSKTSIQNQMGISINTEMTTTEWITEAAGVVRSESYNKNGKLMGYTVLTRRTN